MATRTQGKVIHSINHTDIRDLNCLQNIGHMCPLHTHMCQCGERQYFDNRPPGYERSCSEFMTCSWEQICCCAYTFSQKRSGIYLSENSVEYRYGVEACCCQELCCFPIDYITVQYFDQPPFVTNPCCGCNKGEPQFRVLEPGYMCCCMKLSAENGCGLCYGEKLVIITPCDTYCCCFSNYTDDCGNFYGLCGPITGNPKCYTTIWPQPNTGDDVESFVATAARALGAWREKYARDAVRM